MKKLSRNSNTPWASLPLVATYTGSGARVLGKQCP